MSRPSSPTPVATALVATVATATASDAETATEEKQDTVDALTDCFAALSVAPEPVPKTTTETVIEYVSKQEDKRIVLLRCKEVVMWLFGDLSFLPPIQKKNKTADEAKYKVLEDTWGQTVLRTRRPDLKLDKQWTNKFGEHLWEEIMMLEGKKPSKPEKKVNYQPDGETDDAIWEVKAGTFYTSGTAGEKILGCPFKYAEIPDLHGKPLQILCMGGAERQCREQYGNLPGAKCTPQKKRFLDFFHENKIQYVGATDLLVLLSRT